MSPEVFLEKPYNEKVDVFSFGVIVWELFSQSLISIKVLTNGIYEDVESYAEAVS